MSADDKPSTARTVTGRPGIFVCTAVLPGGDLVCDLPRHHVGEHRSVTVVRWSS